MKKKSLKTDRLDILLIKKKMLESLMYEFNFIESEKYHEWIAATESPPKGGGPFRLDDDTEFPPVTQRTD